MDPHVNAEGTLPAQPSRLRVWTGLVICCAVVATLVYSCNKLLGTKPGKTHTKTVSRTTFPGRWPLTIDGGVLECFDGGQQIVITSGNTTYLVAGVPRPKGESALPI